MAHRILSDGTHIAPSKRVLTILLDQLRLSHQTLEKAADGLNTQLLEWQGTAGCNTIGMLLAHVAVAEAYWIAVGTERFQTMGEVEHYITSTLGITISDDGMPIQVNGRHPVTLTGWTLEHYLGLIRNSQLCLAQETQAWKDDDLFATLHWRGDSLDRAWILYHLLEHVAYHTGQIAQLKHLHRQFNAAQVPPKQESSS